MVEAVLWDATGRVSDCVLSGLLPIRYWILRLDIPGDCTSKGQRRTGRTQSGGDGRFQQRKPGERSPRKGPARTGLFKI